MQLKSILDTVLDQLYLQFQQKQIQIDFTLDVDAKIYVDRIMLETVLRNIISNAIKYSSFKGIVKIECFTKMPAITFNIILKNLK